MNRAEVFFDVDGCLLDWKYKTNMDIEQFRHRIESMTKFGFSFNLNSNRSLDNLLDIYRSFGFNGKIIIENGACIYDPRKDSFYSVGFSTFDRKNLVAALRNERFARIDFIDTDILISHPSKIAVEGKEGQFLCFCEKTRKYTMTVYPRVVRNSKFVFDAHLLDKTKDALSKGYPDYCLEVGLHYGNVLLVPESSSKGAPLKVVAKNSEIVSFGDGDGDISMFDVSDFCGSPANASPKVIERVLNLRGYVSKGRFTKGAFEFLNRLEEI